MCSAVCPVRRVGRPCVERTLLAIADGAHPRILDSESCQIFTRDVRAAISQGEVVLLGSALVTMTLDRHVNGRICFEPRCRDRQRILGVSSQRRFVIVEERIPDPSAILSHLVQGHVVGRKLVAVDVGIDEIRLLLDRVGGARGIGVNGDVARVRRNRRIGAWLHFRAGAAGCRDDQNQCQNQDENAASRETLHSLNLLLLLCRHHIRADVAASSHLRV